MEAPGDPVDSSKQQSNEAPSGQKCDFCGDRVGSVRRVALDQEYDRLQKAHKELYSCAVCFEDKERQRLGLARR
jgi:hypothetical protein